MAGLTDRHLNSLKSEEGKRQEIADDVVRGLSLRFTVASAKTWALRYRMPAGQQRRLTLGAYPALSLSNVRGEAIKALGAVAVQRNPAQGSTEPCGETANRSGPMGDLGARPAAKET